MGLTDVGPPKTEILGNRDKAVGEYADFVRDEAGKIIVSATESAGKQPDGRLVTVEKDKGSVSGGEIETVRVAGKPRLISRIRGRGDESEHIVRRYPNGVVEYFTKRKSVRGGDVTKTARIANVDGVDHVGYEVVRRDSNGNVVPRRGSRAGREVGSRSSAYISTISSAQRTGESEKEARRRRKRVIAPVDAIRERVMGAIASYDPVEPADGFVPSKSVNTPPGLEPRRHNKRGRVQQVPRGAAKYNAPKDTLAENLAQDEVGPDWGRL